MEKIIFYDWHKGFNPVAFNKLLRKHLGYSLSQAKQAADALLMGQSVVIEVTSTFNITDFLSEATKIGAEGRHDLRAAVTKNTFMSAPLIISSLKDPYAGLKEWKSSYEKWALPKIPNTKESVNGLIENPIHKK